MFDFYFCTRLCILKKSECVDFKYDDSFSKLQPINTQIMDFCPKFETFLFFAKHFDKFEGADFKMMEAFSNYSLNIP